MLTTLVIKTPMLTVASCETMRQLVRQRGKVSGGAHCSYGVLMPLDRLFHDKPSAALGFMDTNREANTLLLLMR